MINCQFGSEWFGSSKVKGWLAMACGAPATIPSNPLKSCSCWGRQIGGKANKSTCSTKHYWLIVKKICKCTTAQFAVHTVRAWVLYTVAIKHPKWTIVHSYYMWYTCIYFYLFSEVQCHLQAECSWSLCEELFQLLGASCKRNWELI